ncbi:MAG: sulfatase family protein, partial [Planctomycetota bacterium]
MTESFINRRSFLKSAGLSTSVFIIPGCHWFSRNSDDIKEPANKPNILFCISDDQSWLHAGAYGSRMVKTPTFDRIAREGILFNNAYVSAPSCCPSRGSVLTGRPFYQLEEGAQNWCFLDKKFRVYPDILEDAGYHVGYTYKGWGPGVLERGGRKRNPAGNKYNSKKLTPPANGFTKNDYAANFREFLNDDSQGKPFCFWFGCFEPHRDYEKDSGVKLGKKLEDAEVPPFLPDTPEVRKDLLDYAVEIEWYDKHLAKMIKTLEESGQLENTIIVVTSDNGMPFPRAKTNLYDFGTKMPLAIMWGDKIKPGRIVDDFISFTDFAPTFLEVAGIRPPAEMAGKSFLDILLSERCGQIDPTRDHVVFGRERHHPKAFKTGGQSFPCRAIRTKDYLYIRNYKPGRSCAGDGP